jgi:hypothetical protein
VIVATLATPRTRWRSAAIAYSKRVGRIPLRVLWFNAIGFRYFMLSQNAIRQLLLNLEADNVERTQSLKDGDKVGEAICSFSNDLVDRRAIGVLILGAKDDGTCAGLKITEQNLQTLLGFRDGRIVPVPSLTVRKETIEGCELAIVEVQPSDNPPVKYKGRVCVRRGLQRGFATQDEERKLLEKRVWGNLTFDQQPVLGTTLDDLDLDRFQVEYRSLMPLAQESNKPMFFLRPADGAIGGHQAAVAQCYADFEELALKICEQVGIELHANETAP